MEMPLISVFTPTYNRAHTLSGVYDCLCRQSYPDFEWVVVDDGSTDQTEQLIGSWMNEKRIPIVYVRQANGGKHRAFNRGVKEARGKIFICLDSDDYYEEDALAVLAYCYEEVKNNREIAGFSCLSADRQGNVIGTRLPGDKFVCSHYELYHDYQVKGDKGLIYYTDILKQYPFPEIENEKFVTEALVLNRIARKYKLYCIDRILCRVLYRSDGLSSKYAQLCEKSPRGYALYLNELNYYPSGVWEYILNNSRYVKFARLAGMKAKIIRKEAIARRWYFFLPEVLGCVMIWKWKLLK